MVRSVQTNSPSICLHEFKQIRRRLLFLKVSVDERKRSPGEEVQAMPTFVLYRYGVKMDVIRGADVGALEFDG